MGEDRAVYEALLTAQAAGEVVALATVVDVQGSVPRHAGSKMLVRAGWLHPGHSRRRRYGIAGCPGGFGRHQ